MLNGETLPCPTDCPEEVFELMQECWKSNPEDRISVVDLNKRLKEIYSKLFGEMDDTKPAPPRDVPGYLDPLANEVQDVPGYLDPVTSEVGEVPGYCLDPLPSEV